MSIKAKTRKILWSRAGNRCPICKRLLVHKLDVNNSDFVVGEECHIISSKKKGPRGSIKILEDYDCYENLILLCANDHKLIDNFPETFTYPIVMELKKNHEKWIESAIEKDLENYINSVNNIEVLDEIENHVQLDNVIKHCHMYFFDSSSITDSKTSIDVSELFDNLRDLSDIYSDIEISDKTRYLIQQEERIKKFKDLGILFFGKNITRKFRFKNASESDFKVAIIVAFNPRVSPDSIENGKLKVQLPNDFSPSF